MKILTVLSLVSTLLNPFNGVRVLNETTSVTNSTGNTDFNNSVQVTYNYSVASPSATIGASFYATVEQEVPLVYLCDIYINFRDTVDMAYIKLTFNKPVSGSTYYSLDFVGQNIRIDGSGNTTSNSYMNLYVYETNSAHIQIVFSLAQIINNYNYPSPTTTVINQGVSGILGSEWINKGSTYFRVQTAQMTSCTLDTDIDYTSYIDGLETSINSVNNTLTQINTNIDGVEGLITDLISSVEDLETAINSYHTLGYANIPEYSWSIYYLFKRKWTLKYDSVFPRPYVTTTDDSSTTFSWDDAIQIQDRDLYIVLATFGDSSSTLPVKIIKSNNTDVSSSFTWTYRYTGRYRFYYTRIPSDLFNNALNIKWTREVNVMPVYLGRLNNMPLEVAELCNIDTNNQLIRELEKINNSINGLNNSDLNVEELDPNIIQQINDGVTNNLELIDEPTIPEKLIGTLNYFTSPYVEFINNPKLSIYKYGVLLGLIVSLFRVVIK